MPRREVSGVDVLAAKGANGLLFEDYDMTSFISMFLYLLVDKEWIRDIWIQRRKSMVYLIFYAKREVKIDYAKKIMNDCMIRLKKHLEDIGMKVEKRNISGIRTEGAWSLVYGDSDRNISIWLRQREIFRNAVEAI